ncbi:ribonuclease E inhibitor RraB [Rudaeicoccus suwonensis]|uniref:Regulator of ribonuclease activity B n=1 Tax=Rudaeicoccus suwonensis TaxID=657409 RepID=A0A561E772_9MICO|nr:ribonuclease E inhibitor RraB [Rudaeicoccus suwonensis]TWE11463.1 regulator of ribonuclease activity B [Rudaeicoccus suwonensis]
MTEFLLVFHDRDDAEAVAETLSEDAFESVRVVSESLAGEDDAEDVDWVVHVVAAVDASTEDARALSPRLAALAEKYDGWLDEGATTSLR